MSIPPVPNHPPRPGRRKPAEESPESITTQLFIGQDESAAADGSTQALTPAELKRLRSMVESDGTEATEVLSLEELRQLAAAEGYETGGLPAAPRKANSADIAAAEAASAPKQWNPLPADGTSSQGTGADGTSTGAVNEPGSADSGYDAAAHPHQGQWGQDFGAAAQAGSQSAGRPGGTAQSQGGPQPSGGPAQSPGAPQYAPAGHVPVFGAASAGAAGSGPVGYGGYGPGGPGGPAGPGGPGGYGGPGGPNGPGGPGGPYAPRPQTKKVPAWLWVLAVIALVLAVGIVGYIVWDATQNSDETSAASTDQPSMGQTDNPEPSDSGGSEQPVAQESFTSPSGNIACTIDSERARCVIKDYDYSPPQKPDDCRLDDWGAIVVANKDGAGFSCVEAPEADGPSRVLGYGESISAEGMTCDSTEEGMTCKSDDSGVGFNIRRASVDFLK